MLGLYSLNHKAVINHRGNDFDRNNILLKAFNKYKDIIG